MPGGCLGANRRLVPTAASLVTPGHLQMCWVLASCPAHPAPAPSRRRPKGASWSRAVPLGSERKPVSWRNAHGCHQGSPGPQRAAGWTLAAPQRGRKPATTAMRALVGVFEVNPAPVLRPAEPWAWAAGAPWGSSRPARAAGAGGPGPDGGDAPGTRGPTQRQAHGGLWSRSKLALSPVQTRATAVTAEPRFPRL